MYGVWQTSRHFSQPGLQPWAVSKSLSKLEEWAKVHMPRADSKRPSALTPVTIRSLHDAVAELEALISVLGGH